MGKIKQSQRSKILQHLKRFKTITTKKICQVLWDDFNFTTCPHSIIRDLRKKYIISDTWETDPEKGDRYKRYKLEGMRA